MDSLLELLDRDGRDVARRALMSRTEDGVMDPYLRGELAGLARAARYVGGTPIDTIEALWIAEATPEAERIEGRG